MGTYVSMSTKRIVYIEQLQEDIEEGEVTDSDDESSQDLSTTKVAKSVDISRQKIKDKHRDKEKHYQDEAKKARGDSEKKQADLASAFGFDDDEEEDE